MPRSSINPHTANTKLASMVLGCPALLSVLNRLSIKLGFGDATVADICRRYGLSPRVFLMICNIYTFDTYRPNIEHLQPNDIGHIVAYLRTSHRYYTGVSFPRLHANIHTLLKSCDEVSRQVLDKFYDDYDQEVTKHFDYEESVVFPYIDQLLAQPQGTTHTSYRIEQFEQNHSNIEEKLNDLKNILLKYLTESCSSPLRTEVLMSIFTLEDDLTRHTLIEERVLAPLVAKLERQ